MKKSAITDYLQNFNKEMFLVVYKANALRIILVKFNTAKTPKMKRSGRVGTREMLSKNNLQEE